ncbi:O-methyltransferase [Leptospira kanakyensis]|uniref:O-methyltransferase n=1 Tax=Leptospira kanakyensis TaxID=2484968 RepID=A0A6N4QMF6_9LEPT|nr:O-methyltransferase [Leptospira kanakyensis]MCW7470361.1 O-methyltransferase [Leptospira kanakyensis]TGK54001.1 O-methyltransferase [Leptospira kanakyensis]TGK57796.1 O-methyltransferase [Leptospira kanakyensis]TGK73505.1 O-methyltransferase [Leptospira kanakyensis]
MKPRPSIYIPELESHIDTDLVFKPNPVFAEMETYAKEKNIPIVTAATGAVMSHLVSLLRPKQILELGTGLGYSTLWMAVGSPNSKFVTIDRHEEQASLLEDYAKKMGIFDQIHVKRVTASVMDYLEKEKLEWSESDLFFVDCDKITYPEIFRILWKEANPGSYFLFDNMLWHGRVLAPDPKKPSDLAVMALWNEVKSQVSGYTLYPVGDGLLFFQKDKK